MQAASSRNGDMSAELRVENTSGEKRSVKIRVSIHAVYYTGQPGDQLKTDKMLLELQPGEGEP